MRAILIENYTVMAFALAIVGCNNKPNNHITITFSPSYRSGSLQSGEPWYLVTKHL